MSDVIETSTFEHGGMTFRREIIADIYHGPPWEEEDGHGPVSDWTHRDKRPGELVLNTSHGSKRYYGLAAATQQAREEGWDTPPYGTGTKGERAARAARADYERLKAWCNDEWRYVGVQVTLLDTDGNETPLSESLWGIESDADDYHNDVAREMAEEIARQVPPSGKLEVPVRRQQTEQETTTT